MKAHLSSGRDADPDGESRVQSGHASNRRPVSKHPSGMGDHIPLPQVNVRDPAARNRLRGSSRMLVDENRHSSMGMRETVTSGRNQGGGFFMTQPEMPAMKTTSNSMAPKTGAQATRSGRAAPLLTPGHQRVISLNISQANAPTLMNNTSIIEPVQVSMLDVEREKMKIARFIKNKERAGQNFADRETLIQKRLEEMEKKSKDFDKRKKMERKKMEREMNEK